MITGITVTLRRPRQFSVSETYVPIRLKFPMLMVSAGGID